MTHLEKEYDLVVVGGGMSGVCTAIAAARKGLHTALVQDRSVLGGNASSEIRVHINSAARQIGWKNSIESGIILELLMANKKVNPQYSYYVFDKVVWGKTKFQENLDLFLNSRVFDAKTEGNKITQVTALQTTNETEITFKAKMFADTTGDGILAELSGADYTIGREAKSTYNESAGQEVADKYTMGSTIIFSTKDMGKPTPFKRPDWAYEYTKEMLGSRKFAEFSHGYWWVELGGDEEIAVIEDNEFIHDELIKYIYGVFDYMKNSGEYDTYMKNNCECKVENMALDWIGAIPGKRESRRVYGDYVLNQNDVQDGRRFEDAIAYGGWTMDDHTIGGIKVIGSNEKGNRHLELKDVYTIPYRCIYSRNIDNLYIGGRAISASHMAMSSSRIIGTCSIIGQAIGTAAAIALREDITPREVSAHIKELQQTLIHDDCYIPGIPVEDKAELITNLDCEITASSFIAGGEPTNINGDYARRVDEVQHAWISDEMSANGEWLNVKLPEAKAIKEIIFRFDPNFSETIIPTQQFKKLYGQVPEMPYELVRDYTLTFYKDGEVVKEMDIDDNFQRVNKHNFEDGVLCDNVKITVKSNYGDKHARINDFRLYAE